MTAFPRKRSRRVASTVLAAGALLVGLVTVPAMAANADAGQPDAPSFTAQQLRQHVSHMQQWSGAHQAPLSYQNPTQQQFLDYSQNLAQYWQQLPWADFYGQFGCTVNDVDVNYHATAGDWGLPGATAAVSFSCADSDDLPAVVPDVPDDVIPPAGDAQSDLPVATQALSASGALDVAASIGELNCAISGNHHSVCVGPVATGLIGGSEQNLTKSSDKGHLHLGRIAKGGACNAGTTVLNGPTVTVGANQGTSIYASVNPGYKWVTQWYDPNETSQVCITY